MQLRLLHRSGERVFLRTTYERVRPTQSVFSVHLAGDEPGVQIGDYYIPLTECDPDSLRTEPRHD